MHYFGTDGIRGTVGDAIINPQTMCQLGWALGQTLKDDHTSPQVLIGKDTRVSGYMLESALEAGLIAAGCDCLLLGPMPTPAVAYLTQTLRAQAGIVISASHNPYQDNGVKFFDAQGQKLSPAMEAKITALMQHPMSTCASRHLGRASRLNDAAGRYIEFCKSTLPPTVSLSGVHVILDCAHGATYHTAPRVFRELGAHVTVIHDQPDGFNINEACGSTSPQVLQQHVLQAQADVGIAFDGDGDRCVVVDAQGQLLDGDDILWVIAHHHARHQPLEGVVGSIMSNGGLALALERLGTAFVAAPVGDKHIMRALSDRQWHLGGEPSGHIIVRDRMTSGDGIVAALLVLEALQATGPLDELRRMWDRIPQEHSNLRCSPQAHMHLKDNPQRLEALTAHHQGPDGSRILLRLSGTEPVIRLLLESHDRAWIAQTQHALSGQMKALISQIESSST